MIMKKVYQIKESEIFKIITNLISEESQSNKTVYVSGTIGQSPKYDGLKALFKKFKTTVESELRSEGPYCIINGSTKVERGSGANEIMLKLTLEPCKEEERHTFFDLAGAIYSYDHSQNSSNTRAAVFRSLGDKAKMFTGTKEGGVRILKTNTVGLVGIKDIDPKNPEKQYTLHIGYVVGIKADDYSELGPAETPAETKKAEEPKKISDEKPVDAGTPAAAAATKLTEPTKTQDLSAKADLSEKISSGYTASNCDELHAFQGTGGKVIGNMNVIIGDKLNELYKKGYNPIVTDVSVTVNKMTVNWECTIKNSTDGKAWVGFTSRGAGCNNNVTTRASSAQFGNDVETMKKKILETYNEEKIDITKVSEVNYNGGENTFKQIFYAYTKPGKYPANK